MDSVFRKGAHHPPRPHVSERARLALQSSLAVVLVSLRIYWTGSNQYVFLLWNLFLAWVPWLLARAALRMHRGDKPTRTLAALFVVYVAFLPNAPYLVTDFMHLRYREDAPLWFDAIMLMSFGWTGVSLGVSSLHAWSEIAEDRSGPRAAFALVAGASLLTGFGIYLGRFIRLNSWDVLARPFAVLTNAVAPVVHPFDNLRAWTFTPIFAAFFFVCTVASARTHRERIAAT